MKSLHTALRRYFVRAALLVGASLALSSLAPGSLVPPAHAAGDGPAALPDAGAPVGAVPPAAASASSPLSGPALSSLPPVARGIDAAVDLRAGEGALRFSFPVRAPAWFLWQQATDCQSYVRSIKEVKRCEYFQEHGKAHVLIVAEVLGRSYTVVVGIDRQFKRGHGTIDFESRNVGPSQAKGALKIEPDGDGQARLHFEAKMPRDTEVPELLWRLGVAAAIQSSAARIQHDLEGEYRAVKSRKELLPDIQLRTPTPPRVLPPRVPPPTAP